MTDATTTEQKWEDVFATPEKITNNKEHDQKLVNKIINANCFDYLNELPDDSFDLLVTDPPYYLPIQHHIGHKGYRRTISDDSILTAAFESFFKKIAKVMTSQSAWYVFCDATSYPIFYQVIKPLVKHIRVLVWDKQTTKLGYTWRHQHELIIFATAENFINIPTSNGDIIKQRGIPTEQRIHPIQKPTKLLEKIISKHGTGNLVFDPFAGSGSTGIAAINTKNMYHLVEMEDKYFQTLKKNVQSHTNISGGSS